MKPGLKGNLKLFAVSSMIYLGASSGIGFADTLSLSYSETASGTVGSGTINTLPVPSSYYYGNTYYAPTTTIPGSSYGFYDDFIFSITGAVGNSVTSSINESSLLDFSDIQVRLFDANGQTTLPVLGTPTGPVIYASSSIINYGPGVSGTLNVIPDTMLGPGTYVLEVYGDVSGTSGGSYSGTLNLAPVPLPSSLSLMLAGLGLLAGLFYTRKAV